MTKFNVGDRVWVVNYNNGEVDGVCGLLFLGANDNYAFLSPFFCTWRDLTPDEICEDFFYKWVEDGDKTEIVVYPLELCFATRKEAEAQCDLEVGE